MDLRKLRPWLSRSNMGVVTEIMLRNCKDAKRRKHWLRIAGHVIRMELRFQKMVAESRVRVPSPSPESESPVSVAA